MEVNIKSIHFDATEKLQDFINKKVNRLARHYENISNVEVTLNVVKPETSMNKEAGIKISVPQQEDIFASKTADSDKTLKSLERNVDNSAGRFKVEVSQTGDKVSVKVLKRYNHKVEAATSWPALVEIVDAASKWQPSTLLLERI